MNRRIVVLGWILVLGLSPSLLEAQSLSKQQQEAFKEKCLVLAKTFCTYIEGLTEDNSKSKDMSPEEFFESDMCQWTIGQMKKFFSKEHANSNKIIDYTPTGKPPHKSTSIDGYIRLLLNQRRKYKSVLYDFAAFQITDLEKKKGENGKVYYEGKVNFQQNYFASKHSTGNSEKKWDVEHEDYKSLTFTIDVIETRDGKYFAISFHKLVLNYDSY